MKFDENILANFMGKRTVGVKEFRDIINRSHALVFIWRVVPGEWPVDFVSKNVKDVLGYTAKDFMSGRVSWPGITHPEDVPRLEAEVAKYLEDGKMEWSQEYRLITKSGEIRWFTDRNNVVSDSKGEITHIQSVVVDITEQKKMQEEAEDIRERFTGLFNSSKDAIGFSSLDGTLLDINDSFSDLTGYTKKELLTGKKYQDITPKEYHEYETKIIEGILRTGKPAEYEKEYIRKDGSHVPILLTTFIVKGRDGQPIALAAIIKDISERKKNEKAIRESEEKYRSIVENTSELIYMIDKDFRVLSLNSSAANILGGKPHEFIGKSLFEIFPEETASHHVETLKHIFKTGEKTPLRETRMVVGEEEHWITALLNPVRDEAGNIVAVVGFSNDITERKKAEQSLQKSEDRYRRLVELSPDGLMIFDLNGIVTSCNPALLSLSGYSENEISGKHFSRLPFLRMRDISRYMRIFSQVLRGEIHQPFEISFERKDGTLGWGSISLGQLREGREVVGVQADVRDVTDRRRLEEREDSLRSLIIYDIRNKLLNIRDFLELLGQTDLSEKQQEHVHTLRMLYDDIVELMDRAR